MTKIAELADKIEGQLKLHDGLGGDFRFVMTPDAARAFVEQLRATEKLVQHNETMRSALTELDIIALPLSLRVIVENALAAGHG